MRETEYTFYHTKHQPYSKCSSLHIKKRSDSQWSIFKHIFDNRCFNVWFTFLMVQITAGFVWCLEREFKTGIHKIHFMRNQQNLKNRLFKCHKLETVHPYVRLVEYSLNCYFSFNSPQSACEQSINQVYSLRFLLVKYISDGYVTTLVQCAEPVLKCWWISTIHKSVRDSPS